MTKVVFQINGKNMEFTTNSVGTTGYPNGKNK